MNHETAVAPHGGKLNNLVADDQRAELLNLVLGDLYGPRTLVSKGILPAELVFSHPGFLYPCAGIEHPERRPLMFYAADLVRTAASAGLR